MYTGFPQAVLVVVCAGCSSGVTETPIPWVMMAWAREVRRRRPLSGRPWRMYPYITWKRYPVLGWNFWHVMVCRRSFSSFPPGRVVHLCCRGRMHAS